MFKKDKFKGPWNDNIKVIMEQSVDILANKIAEFTEEEISKKEQDAIGNMIRELVLDISTRVWNNAKFVYDREPESRIDQLLGKWPANYYTKTTFKVPEEKMKEYVKEYLDENPEIVKQFAPEEEKKDKTKPPKKRPGQEKDPII